MIHNIPIYKRDLTTVLPHCCCPHLWCYHQSANLSSVLLSGLPPLQGDDQAGLPSRSAKLICKSLACTIPYNENNSSKQINSFITNITDFAVWGLKDTTFHNLFVHTPTLGNCTELHEYQQQLLRAPEDGQQLKIINTSF